MKTNAFSVLLLLFVIVLSYRNWFFFPEIIGGDWPYFFDDAIKSMSFFPPAWISTQGNGLGGTIISYNLDQYLYLTAQFTRIFSIPWPIVYKLFWFGFFLFLSLVSSILFIRRVLPAATVWMISIGALLFTVNSYILMVVGGGQMGVALAYGIGPLVLTRFIRLIDFFDSRGKNFQFPISNFKLSIFAGFVLAIQIVFDPRIAYITMIATLLYILMQLRKFKKRIVASLFIAIVIALLLNSFWLLPMLLSRSTGIPQGFFTPQSFQFFSFADFSHTLSFLHPNWPENIFGKTYFLKPDFLGLPILAYASLLFLNAKCKMQNANKQLKVQNFDSNGTILFFALLGLLGAFLAKGVNPPFEQVNQWLFIHIPGMNLFRDPTKFYMLIALSYSVLIAFSINAIYQWLSTKYKVQSTNLQSKIKNFIPQTFVIFSSFYLIFLIYSAVFGQLGGTFQKREVPEEYVKLKDFLYSQPEFFRTLWVPKQSRFAFALSNHPAIEAVPLFKATGSAQVIKALQTDTSQQHLTRLSVKFILIPYDSSGEIFLKDRKYNQAERMEVEKQLDTIPWLKKRRSGNISIYETISYNDRFILQNEGKTSYEIISPTTYIVSVSTKSENRLIFSESYSPYWIGKIGNRTVYSIKTGEGLNSFIVPFGEYHMEILYTPDNYYFYGRIIAITTFLIAIIALFVLKSINYYGKKK